MGSGLDSGSSMRSNEAEVAVQDRQSAEDPLVTPYKKSYLI